MERINRLKIILETHNLDAILVTSEPNITYLSGFTGDSSRLISGLNGSFFITDGRYTEQAEKECHKEIKTLKWLDDVRYGTETYQYVLNQLNIKRLGFEANVVAFSTYSQLNNELKGVELVPVSGLIEDLRLIKDQEEINHLKIASEISDKALELTIPYIKEGVTELEVLARLEYNLKTNGAEGLSFDTMVLSGTKTSLLHGKADQKKIESGDFLLFDFGALYKGYHADISRTFIVGKPNTMQKEMYDIILTSQANACNAIKDGIPTKTLDDEARKVIPEKYIDYYYPGLGHGVGLVIHEEPFITNKSKCTLKENMTITIEPGIYIPGVGGLRIEDTVQVTKTGFTSFNRFSRDLTCL